jgi:hypothetical protein
MIPGFVYLLVLIHQLTNIILSLGTTWIGLAEFLIAMGIWRCPISVEEFVEYILI